MDEAAGGPWGVMCVICTRGDMRGLTVAVLFGPYGAPASEQERPRLMGMGIILVVGMPCGHMIPFYGRGSHTG